jgi:hypothetical protein
MAEDVIATPANEKGTTPVTDDLGLGDLSQITAEQYQQILNQMDAWAKEQDWYQAPEQTQQDDAWLAFENYAKSIGLDPSTLKGQTGALPTSFYQSMLPEGMSQSDMIREDLIMDPSYQFRLGEGQKAIERRQNAMGNRFSGAGLTELTRYGQDYASQEYGNAYNRLAGITGTGQTVGSSLNQLGQMYGSNMGNIMQGAGQNIGNNMLYQGAMGGNSISAGAYPGYNQWNQLGKIDWNNIFGG